MLAPVSRLSRNAWFQHRLKMKDSMLTCHHAISLAPVSNSAGITSVLMLTRNNLTSRIVDSQTVEVTSLSKICLWRYSTRPIHALRIFLFFELYSLFSISWKLGGNLPISILAPSGTRPPIPWRGLIRYLCVDTITHRRQPLGWLHWDERSHYVTPFLFSRFTSFRAATNAFMKCFASWSSCRTDRTLGSEFRSSSMIHFGYLSYSTLDVCPSLTNASQRLVPTQTENYGQHALMSSRQHQ